MYYSIAQVSSRSSSRMWIHSTPRGPLYPGAPILHSPVYTCTHVYTPCSVYTLHTVYFYIVQCTLYNVLSRMYSYTCTIVINGHCPQWTSRVVHCYNVEVYIVQCTMYNVQCTQYNVHCTMYNVQLTLSYADCKLWYAAKREYWIFYWKLFHFYSNFLIIDVATCYHY